MAITCEFETKAHYLLSTIHGSPETLDDFFDYIMKIVFESIKEKRNCILVNETDASVRFDVLDSVLLSKRFNKNSLQFLGIRVAIIVQNHALPIYKHFETSLQNRSFNLMAFDDFEEGRTWLLRACVLDE